MSNFIAEFTSNFLPEADVPFYSNLEELFCAGKEQIQDLSIHYPNVIRCIREIMLNYGRNIIIEHNNQPNETEMRIANETPAIHKCLEITGSELKEKALDALQVAALYHDIGKVIRQANHPRLGVNILRNMNNKERTKLVERLVMRDDRNNSKSNEHRFSLLCSIVDHHDKFGVVSTGEGSLALFSDILYFRSDEKTISGIKKNITSVMLLNLADIAAVCTADKDTKKKAADLVSRILKDRSLIQGNDYKELCGIWEDPSSFMGLSYDKVTNIFDDWQELIKAIEKETVLGDRTKLREYLIRLDQNPYRAIKRIIRIIKECFYTTNCNSLLPHISETDIESTLVSSFGAHQFQDFCMKFAYIAKMDYGLKFFKGIVCACSRGKINTQTENGTWQKLSKAEEEELSRLPEEEKQAVIKKVSKVLIQVFSGIIMRYNSMLELKLESAYRFGLQMRTLTEDDNVREKILDYLCTKENMDLVALTWIADEVTFWSMD